MTFYAKEESGAVFFIQKKYIRKSIFSKEGPTVLICSDGPEDAADDKGHDSSNGLSAFAEPSPNDSRASQRWPSSGHSALLPPAPA